QKLVKDCTGTAETECASCGKGEFQDSFSRETHCHQHKYCDHNLGFQVRTEGTLDTDTTCRCKEGQHCTGEACERCLPHSECSPGYGVKQMATEVSDTICEPCRAGFFSNVSSASEKCSQGRMRVLLVLPITMGILLVVFLVFACIKKVAKKPEEKVIHHETKHFPEEIEDSSPVQETLHGCQPVAQEDGKESRISVQERL
ncbi:Tumor necrosis factor receptor superfamily member 5, partial [Galemys pyrenaicus]